LSISGFGVRATYPIPWRLTDIAVRVKKPQKRGTEKQNN